MKKYLSQDFDLRFTSANAEVIDKRKIFRPARLEMLCIELEQLADEDESAWPPNQQLIEIRDAAYEFLRAADDFLGYDPTPQFLYDNTGGEPPTSSQELWMTDFNKKWSQCND